MSASHTTAEPLEALLEREILHLYHTVAETPDQDFHFHHGREAAEMFGYAAEWLDRAPAGAVASFAGVGNPHERADIRPGDTTLEIGSGAGLDLIISAWRAGEGGEAIGVDFNPAMLERAEEHAREAGVSVDLRPGRMEDLPVEDGTVDVITSNGVVNLSFRKVRVFQEMFRVLAPGGRLSFTDIVSARPLSQDIKKDPKLWAS